jgi:hypothetical protein
MTFRWFFAVLAVAFVAVALLVWQPWTGQLKGTVYFTACGGTEPANRPPGYKNCTTTVAARAQVTTSPEGGGSSTQTVADSSGRYNIRLMPGKYYVWGTTTRPYYVHGQRRLVPISANTTLLVDIDVALFAP